MNFSKWLDTLVSEKNIDTEEILEVEGPIWGTNYIPVACVIEAIKDAPKHEQVSIKDMLVKIDFCHAPIVPYFKHLAQAIAK